MAMKKPYLSTPGLRQTGSGVERKSSVSWGCTQDSAVGISQRCCSTCQVGRPPLCLETHHTKYFTYTALLQGCSSTEGLCGNVFRDGETAASSDRTLGEDVEANTQAGGVGREGIERTSNGEMPARFILTG